MWVRGLKLVVRHRPHQGFAVAPYVGAWIETHFHKSICFIIRSHPMWVRGLKLPNSKKPVGILYVAPYVGAWIETKSDRPKRRHHGSHPMWVRGLKLVFQRCAHCTCESHPMWVRGLKHFQTNDS